MKVIYDYDLINLLSFQTNINKVDAMDKSFHDVFAYKVINTHSSFS